MTTTTATTAVLPSQPVRLKLNPLQQWQIFRNPRAMHDWVREHYGDMVILHFQGRDHFAVLSPKAARAVFSADPDNYEVFWRESFTNLMGEEQIWVLTGEQHRRERNLCAPAVHASHFRAYGSVIREIVRDHLKKWQPGQKIKARDTTLLILLDVIMRLVFGVEEADFMEEGRVLFEEWRVAAHPLVVFFPALQKPWFPLWRRYQKAVAAITNWMERFFAARRARPAPGGDSDMLGALMNSRDENGQPVSDEHIRNELKAVLSAGHETTAGALGWAMYELARNPHVMEKLRAELAPLGPDFDPSLALTLPYLDAVCKETLRLHTHLSECGRIAIQPMQVLGHQIAAGQAMVIAISGIHHDPNLYPEPNVFRPERFLERKYDLFEFLPYGGGHRRCLGAALAEYTLRIALAEIVLGWDFEPNGVDRDVRLNVANGPQKGIPIRIKGRRK
jgi:cytochrome P450 family 110